MSRYNKLMLEQDIVIPFLDNSTKLVVDTDYGNSLSIFSSSEGGDMKSIVEVDWGDGLKEPYLIGHSDTISHKYTKAGKFKVIIKHRPYASLKFYDQDIITEVTSIGYMDNYNGTFMQCENLSKLEYDCFKKRKSITSLVNTFKNCFSLQSIPGSLLNGMTELECIDGLFKGCSLYSIPELLFLSNFNLKSLVGTFQDNPISILKTNIFKNTSKITNMSYCFAGTSIETIEPNIFDKLVNLLDVSYIFYDCLILKTIPEDLFKFSTKLYNVTGTFCNTVCLEKLPTSTFKYNKNISESRHVVVNCKGWNGEQIIFSEK